MLGDDAVAGTAASLLVLLSTFWSIWRKSLPLRLLLQLPCAQELGAWTVARSAPGLRTEPRL